MGDTLMYLTKHLRECLEVIETIEKVAATDADYDMRNEIICRLLNENDGKFEAVGLYLALSSDTMINIDKILVVMQDAKKEVQAVLDGLHS